MKKSNILQLLEMHVDKIVMGLMILISLVVLWKYVIANPYGAEFDGDKLGPGEIDSHVKTQADMLSEKLQENAEPVPYNKTYLADYDALVQCPIKSISSLAIPYPGTGEASVQEERIYALPQIPQLNNVAAAHLRGAAQLPIDEIGPDRPYLSGQVEPGDLDLVTVSAVFNIESLFNSFQQSFMAPRLKPTWRDANLAKPIFARLELERRELNDDGTWGQWVQIPRTKIDMYRKMLQELPLTTDKLQFAVNIMSSQFADAAVQADILQPQAYSFIISRSEWMPPAYLNEFISITEKEYIENQRKFRQEQNKLREEAKRPEGSTTRTPSRQPQPKQRPGREQNPLQPTVDPAQLKQTTKKERTTNDVKSDLQKAILGNKDPLTMKDALLLWAHDDTVLPGTTYQYRLRVGVFNPIAGKDWFTSEQAKFKEQVVLWSDYTQPTADVYVPKRVHVFPLELIAAKDGQDGTQGVKVEVAKYNLGQWCTQTFDVFPGQIIGQKAEYTPKVISNPMTGGIPNFATPMDVGMGIRTVAASSSDAAGTPQIVDFTTPYTMVDINRIVSWGTSAQKRNTLDVMLYHDPQKQLKRAGIGKSNWDSSLREEENQVKDEMERGTQQQNDTISPLQMMPTPMPMQPIEQVPPI